jgi:hypothetical protein
VREREREDKREGNTTISVKGHHTRLLTCGNNYDTQIQHTSTKINNTTYLTGLSPQGLGLSTADTHLSS